ncbi:hypothetical protein [Caldicellulosiruptor naganoensis]|uniref:hypothetical protein n=1 Tax=Caldicellulosiruptor naganoensis TaxID=29324 RepID=UPI0005EBB9F8|nr:hypothetical protein [Caldicellulosiruptor naganoensis]
MFSTPTLYKIIVSLLGPEVLEKYEMDYNSRLLIQKAIYLLQELIGKELYNFSWYLAGPYSPLLSRQVFNEILTNLEEVKKEAENVRFTEKGEKFIKKVKEFFEMEGDQLEHLNLTKADWYELLASMYYLYKRGQIDSKEDLKRAIKVNKKRFNEEQICFSIEEFYKRVQGIDENGKI